MPQVRRLSSEENWERISHENRKCFCAFIARVLNFSAIAPVLGFTELINYNNANYDWKDRAIIIVTMITITEIFIAFAKGDSD